MICVLSPRIRIVVAGPSCGKSTLVQRSNRHIIDGDDVSLLVTPDYWNVRQNFTEAEQMAHETEFWAYVGSELDKDSDALLLTSKWPRHIPHAIKKYALNGWPIMFWRDDPLTVHRKMVSPVPLNEIQKWYSDVKKYSSLIIQTLIWLKEDEHLADVIRFSYPRAR